MLKIILAFIIAASMKILTAQMMIDTNNIEHHYTRKSFVVREDTARFKDIGDRINGLSRYHFTMNVNFYDLDNSKKYIADVNQDALVAIEGYFQNKQKNGLFTIFIMDSLNPNIRYKIWEETYRNDKLNGSVKAYTLQGKLAASYQYRNDTLVGEAITYAADGIRKLSEIIYDNHPGKYLKKIYNDTTGKLMREEHYENYELNGKVRDYYPNGKIEMDEFFINGKMTGARKHFYPSGAIWHILEYNNGKPWMALGAYLENGRPLNPGNLANGTGSVLFYDEYGNVIETHIFLKGELVR